MSEALWYCPICQAEGTEPGTTFCSNEGGRVRPISERGAEWIGRTLADRYRILRFVAAGGTAEVFEAERLGSGKRVALKLLHATMAANMSAAFQREARMVSLIAHPNVVAIDDFGTLPSGINYMVMELLDGKPLDQPLQAGPLPVALALKYAMQACEGLAAAHARDVLHCDIKPANFFLHRVPGSVDPVVKILDLGIGRMLATAGTERAAGVSGTPEYMSPEQAQGGELEAAADIYSMGVTVWEMLLGRVPFEHESYEEVLHMQIHATPTWPADLAAERGIPAEAGPVLLKALAKDPAERHGSMLDLQTELASVARLVRARTTHSMMPPPQSRQRTTGPFSSVPMIPPTITHTTPPTTATVPIRPPTSTPLSHTPSSVPKLVNAASLPPVSAPLSTPNPPPSVPSMMSANVAAPASTSSVRSVRLGEATGNDDEVAELAPDVHWVGRRRGQLLENNAYLLTFRRGTKQVRVLVDPGPPEDFAILSHKVESLVGSMDRLDYVFLHHRAPDVAGSAGAIQQRSRTTQIICSEDTFRHARAYGLDPNRFMAVESFPGGVCTLPTGNAITFVPTPFCHHRGAVMLFDPGSRVLFSGTLFGGARAPKLVAWEGSWPGIEMFHQIYMPTQRALGLAVGRVQRLTPTPALIAPQHGAMILGRDIGTFIERIGRLEVGVDLPEKPAHVERYLAAANAIALEYENIAGVEGSRELKAGFTDGTFTRLFTLDGRRSIVSFTVAPRLALEAFARDAVAAVPAEQRNELARKVEAIWRRNELDGPATAEPAGTAPVAPTSRR